MCIGFELTCVDAYAHEVVIDSLFINDVFANTGGVKGLNKLLNNQLDIVIDELNTYLWQAS